MFRDDLWNQLESQSQFRILQNLLQSIRFRSAFTII